MNEYLILLYYMSCYRRGCGGSSCCGISAPRTSGALPSSCPPQCPPPCPPPCQPQCPLPRNGGCEVCHKNPCECKCGHGRSQDYHGEVFGYASQIYPHLGDLPTCPPPPKCSCEPPCSPPPRREAPRRSCGCDEYSRYNPRYKR